jgi:hypothetical protein
LDTGLIRINESPAPQDLREELQQLFQEQQIKALTALVKKQTPTDVIKKRPIRGGGETDYVPGWWFVEQANALFGHLWSFEIVDHGIGDRQVWVKGKVTIRIPGRRREVIGADGTREVVETEGTTIEKYQFGGHDIAKSSKTGETVDIGDTLKAAATDCMKKCLTQIGIAADVYGDREELELRLAIASTEEATRRNVETLLAVGKDIEWGKDEIEDWVRKTFKKSLEEFTGDEFFPVIRALREVENAHQEA